MPSEILERRRIRLADNVLYPLKTLKGGRPGGVGLFVFQEPAGIGHLPLAAARVVARLHQGQLPPGQAAPDALHARDAPLGVFYRVGAGVAQDAVVVLLMLPVLPPGSAGGESLFEVADARFERTEPLGEFLLALSYRRNAAGEFPDEVCRFRTFIRHVGASTVVHRVAHQPAIAVSP